MSKLKKTLAASTIVSGLFLGATSATAAIVDLGFIIDESGSVGQSNYESSIVALRNAINQIPLATATVTYRVGVVSFGAIADTVAAPVVFDSQANKDTVLAALLDESVRNSIDGGSLEYGDPSGITNNTLYAPALNLINSEFASAFGTLGDTSIVNMATDGGNGDNTATQTAVTNLIADGWDALSFEAVANTSSSAEAYLATIGFDTNAGVTTQGGCTQTTNAATLGNVVENCFVIDVPSFAAFEDAILTKVQRTVIDTGGGTGVIPLPAAGWMLLAGLGALGLTKRRQSA